MFDISDATDADIPALTQLHNLNIRTGLALWVEAEVSEAERRAWLDARQAAGLPVLVARSDQFLGYASFGPYREKTGYRLSMEHSVYVAPQAQGRGVAYALMQALIARASAAGVHAMIGAIEAGNAASISLHRKLGFAEVGRMPEVGVKFSTWLDLVLMQRILDPGAAPPQDLRA